MEPESLGDFELQKEEGVNIGEQVFQDTGDPMTNARNVWESGAIDQEIYQLNFELFFKSGDWQDHISRGTVQGDTQMASAPGIPGIEGFKTRWKTWVSIRSWTTTRNDATRNDPTRNDATRNDATTRFETWV